MTIIISLIVIILILTIVVVALKLTIIFKVQKEEQIVEGVISMHR